MYGHTGDEMTYRIKPIEACSSCQIAKCDLGKITDDQIFKNGAGRLFIFVHGDGECGGMCEVEETPLTAMNEEAM